MFSEQTFQKKFKVFISFFFSFSDFVGDFFRMFSFFLMTVRDESGSSSTLRFLSRELTVALSSLYEVKISRLTIEVIYLSKL